MGYPRSEQETTLVYELETNLWNAYSTVPKHMRRITSIAKDVTVLEKEDGNILAIKAKLTSKQVRMVNERVMSEEQRQAASLRMKSLHEKVNEETAENDFDLED